MSRPSTAASHPVRPELEVAFRLAATRERRIAACARVATLVGRCDPTVLADELAARRLLPLIGSRIVALVPEHVPRQLAERVDAACGESRARGLALSALTHSLVGRLEQEEIPSLPLKGPLLAEAVYGDVGLRAASDVDLLVPVGELARAVAIARTLGYGTPLDPLRSGGLPDLHFSLPHERLASLELHWRIHWYERDFSRDMLHRASVGRDGLRRVDRLDEIVSLLLYYARDGFHGLRHVADVGAWFDRYGAGLARGALAPHLRAYPALARALAAAALVAERVTGAPTMRTLAAPPRGRRILLATRLADWSGEGERDQLAANVSLIDGLLAPAAGMGEFAQRRLLTIHPTQRANAPPVARAVHAAKVTARYASALWSVRRGRRFSELPP